MTFLNIDSRLRLDLSWFEEYEQKSDDRLSQGTLPLAAAPASVSFFQHSERCVVLLIW